MLLQLEVKMSSEYTRRWYDKYSEVVVMSAKEYFQLQSELAGCRDDKERLQEQIADLLN